MSYKLGSLFDGSGGFPLSGTLCNIEPMWAAEVEPYPIAVTTSRFPNMKHLGDISKVNGAEIEPVDIITFGSPCQDLSVAGKRAGLKHEANGDDETTRSGLFMEAVRIIKEMRKATNGKYPRFAVWENVPGAFSSNNGEDFRIVLEELVKVVEPYAVMPEVPQKGWSYADSYSGDGWSLAYRVFDAQYWGVPQRRRRIYLVADFGGECAREILFEREGLRGYFTQGGHPWKNTSSDTEGSIGTDDSEGAVCYGISSYDSNAMKSSNPYSGTYETDTSRTLDLNGGNPACNQGGIAVVENVPYTLKIRSGCETDAKGKAAGKGALIQKNLSATLGTSQDQYLFSPIGADPYNGEVTGDKAATLGVNCGMSTGRNGVITDAHILDDQGGQQISVRTDGKAPTLRAEAHGNVPCAVTLEPGIASREGGHIYEGVSGTLRANAGDNQMAVAYGVTTKGNGDAFVAEERHTALSVGGGQAGQGYPCVCYGVDAYNQALTGDKAKTLNSAASDADHVPCTVYSVENHPNDSRCKIDEDGMVQALTSRMGTGGGNVPMVMEPYCKSARGRFKGDVTTWKSAKVANTLNTFDQGEARANEVVVAYGLDRASFNQGQNAKFDFSILDEQQPTLTAMGPGAVCCADETKGVAYSFDPGASRDVGVLFLEECGKTLTNGTCPGHHDGVVITRPIYSMTTGEYMQVNEEKTATLLARDYKDPTCVEFFDPKERRYIVRRLTPTECARLQGFPDVWGHLEPKTSLTEDEYKFWLNVRKTHDAINGKTSKEYNEKQMLTYYNKLWTDSSEYKMWGNGIALPCALYVIQGIKDVLAKEQIARRKWLDDLLN